MPTQLTCYLPPWKQDARSAVMFYFHGAYITLLSESFRITSKVMLHIKQKTTLAEANSQQSFEYFEKQYFQARIKII